MADNENNDNKQSYGIAEALTEALEAAVFADCSACYKAYDMIEKYAYGYDPDDDSAMNRDNKDDDTTASMNRTLDMAEFNITGSDGQPRTVYIPKITMMPLPLLHVTEATFDIEMNANIVTVKNTEEAKMNPDATPTASDTPGTYRPTAEEAAASQAIAGTRPSSTDATTGSRPASTNATTGSRPSSTAVSGSRPSSNTSTGSRPTSDTTTGTTPSRSTSTGSRAASSRGGVRVDGRGRSRTGSANASTPTEATPLKLQRPTTAGLRRELTVAARRKMLVENRIKSSTVATTGKQMEIGGTKSSSSETNTSTINMKVRVEMKQAELPSGIKLLLQSAANGLAIAARDLAGEPVDDYIDNIDTQDGFGEGYPDDYEDIAE